MKRTLTIFDHDKKLVALTFWVDQYDFVYFRSCFIIGAKSWKLS